MRQCAAPVHRYVAPLTEAVPVSVTGGFTQAVAAAVAETVLPPAIQAALTGADAMRGQQLSLSKGCIACHSLDPNQPMPGPTWRGVGQTAATREAAQSAELYLYNSIVHPNAHVVEGFPPNIMIQTYRELLADQEIADLIAYLLTLQR